MLYQYYLKHTWLGGGGGGGGFNSNDPPFQENTLILTLKACDLMIR